MKNKKENLENIIKTLENKVHSIVLEDREGQFLVDNTGELVVVILGNGTEVTGELLDIDKNRICLNVNGTSTFYYKHAVVAYYKK